MNILRRLAIWALLSVFFTSLLLLAYGWMFNETFGNRETVKSWFERSGAYTNFVDEVVAVSQQQAAEEGNVVDAEILATAANSSFTPELLQTSLETVLDGAYDWLEGSTQDIEFTVDFTDAKTRFADNLSQFAVERVEGLLDCELGSELQSFDPFSAPCKPVFLDINLITSDFRQIILEDENFLKQPRITASEITVGEKGELQTLGEAASVLPTGYQIARYGAVISLLLAFLSAVGIMLIAKSKRKGVFKLFRGFLFTAISLGIFTFFSSRSTGWLDSVLAVDPSAEGFTERIIKPLIITIGDDLSTWTYRFMIGYAVIAFIVLFVYLYLLHRKKRIEKLHKPKSKEQLHRLENSYRKLVAKEPKEYKKSYPERKKTLKKKHTQKTTKHKKAKSTGKK